MSLVYNILSMPLSSGQLCALVFDSDDKASPVWSLNLSNIQMEN